MLSQKVPPWVFDRVLSMHLLSLTYTHEKGRVFRVDQLHKNGFEFLDHFLLLF